LAGKLSSSLLGAVCLVVVGVFLLYRRMGPLPTLTDRDIAGATTITSEWLEIKPDPVLEVSSRTPLVILELEGDTHLTLVLKSCVIRTARSAHPMYS